MPGSGSERLRENWRKHYLFLSCSNLPVASTYGQYYDTGRISIWSNPIWLLFCCNFKGNSGSLKSCLLQKAGHPASWCCVYETNRLHNKWELVGCSGSVMLMISCSPEPLPPNRFLSHLVSSPWAEQLHQTLLTVCQCTSNGKEWQHVAFLGEAVSWFWLFQKHWQEFLLDMKCPGVSWALAASSSASLSAPEHQKLTKLKRSCLMDCTDSASSDCL